MPEGDTVHKLAQALRTELRGAVLVGVEARGRALPTLAGREVVDVRAQGKHLYVELGHGQALRSHLGMYGSWHAYRPGEPWHKPARRARLVLRLATRVLVCFDARDVELMETAGVRAREMARSLGPDVLASGFDPRDAAERAARLLAPETPLVDLLLDQRIACGIGNVYKSELLFLQGLAPLRCLAETGTDLLVAIYEQAVGLMTRNLRGGARRTRFVGNGPRLWVYGRGGRPCLACGAPIRRGALGRALRGTWWCEVCQRPAA